MGAMGGGIKAVVRCEVLLMLNDLMLNEKCMTKYMMVKEIREDILACNRITSQGSDGLKSELYHQFVDILAPALLERAQVVPESLSTGLLNIIKQMEQGEAGKC